MIQDTQHFTAKIVIVDDIPENLRLLVNMLTEEGYRMWPAPNGARALATIEKNRPDLILLDILMPEMDGYEVCRRLKADERTRDIPVIFLSALNEVGNQVKGFELGAIDYITKPFQAEEVLDIVELFSLNAKKANLQIDVQATLPEANSVWSGYPGPPDAQFSCYSHTATGARPS